MYWSSIAGWQIPPIPAQTEELKTTCIISPFPWTGNPGAASLGPPTQGLMRCQCRGQPGCGGVEAPRRNVALSGSLWGSRGAPSVACHGGLLRAPQERRWREKEAVPAFYKPISEATSQQVYCLPFVKNARPWIQLARRRRASCRVRGPEGQGHREPPRKQPPVHTRGAYRCFMQVAPS